jgi:general L-amino acid transport system substrate-binding protein
MWDGLGTVRRLAAVAGLCVLLGACGEPTPSAEEKAVKALAKSSTPEQYKPATSPTLEAIRRRGRLTCGVNPSLPGFAFPDARGEWRGFDVDICRAVAAATLGDATKVTFVRIEGSDRFSALQKGQIDILSRNTSQTLARSAGLGLSFPVVTYYDGQGFLVPKALGVASAEELSGARVCVGRATVSRENLQDYFAVSGMRLKIVPARSEADARRMYEAEQCDIYSGDVSALAASRSLLSNPNAHVILSNIISREPLGPVVRRDDQVWADIVRWTVYGLVLGEELGLSSKTVEQARKTSTDPEVRRLLGVEGELGSLLGLKPDWAYQAIRQVGAYHEIFRRDLGEDSALKLDRGLNGLWNADKPGLMYAPPIR